ncbi:antibiotic biosynthesis monooxygenase family protein [Streptomyces indicus]|uniref:Heme-degrading monooxygenase HmoA n=1 Tax=Streptomyces indicus TaxID=417292 RepID=A0A1G9ERS9_9ACTN|nr:antibiotic biosynthesis monooxygenase [Streptomyces indicus]SDK78830.1 Heme-degrading monooxygenase HmoA [Streptomyces indicus]
MEITPVEAFELPYYTVVFTSVKKPEAYADGSYPEAAQLMNDLVKGVDGYLGHENASTPGGLSITVGYFRDEEAIKAWRQNLEHQRVQKQGRAEWYDSYTCHVAKVERSYGFRRDA